MFSSLLKPEIQKFINDNTEKETSKLALQKNPFPDNNWIAIINQIMARNKAKGKLPTWFSAQNIIYPGRVSIEQTSSEKTAAYKTELIEGESLIDLTGGFGVDDYYFSKKVKYLVHCEINKELSAIVQHNFKQLGINTIKCLSGDSTELLKTLNQYWDWIYIDPSRRNDHKGKVFMLRDCLPNVPELLEFYFKYTSHILIKTAPLLDITSGISELQYVKSIHIVAVDNEVKELLWELDKGYNNDYSVKTIHITKERTEIFSTIPAVSNNANYSLPKKYLYEPNSAIMKSGAFDAVAVHYKIDKLHRHSHLYTTNELIDFPGRIFEIRQIIPYQKKEIKTCLEGKQANITTRNFPDSVESIRKKWKIKEGGDQYYFFTTDLNSAKIILICTKLK